MYSYDISPKPFLRWAGSKKKLVPELIKYWTSDYNVYFEPFMGSAHLFFAVQPNKAIISDINSELVETYNSLIQFPEEVYKILISFPITKEQFYLLREKELNSLSSVERSARFIYLNRYCFNGLYRTNLAGKFNVPYSNNKTGNLPSLETLFASVDLLKNAQIVCGDFEEIIRKNIAKNDFVYLDPPYAVKNKRIFSQYNPQTFGLEDLARLSKLLYEIDSRGAKFLLSYAYSDEHSTLFENWNQANLNIRRDIAGFAKFRRIEHELLVTNL